jgi:hypothetical protein
MIQITTPRQNAAAEIQHDGMSQHKCRRSQNLDIFMTNFIRISFCHLTDIFPPKKLCLKYLPVMVSY